jgi:ABC-type transport system substrate-binding protein
VAGAPATGLLPPGLPGQGAAAAPASCPACAHDPARAKALFAKVKGGRGPLTLEVATGPVERRIAGLVAADLATAGVKMQVRTSDDPGGSVFGVGWVADSPRMDALLYEPFHSRGAANRTGFASPAVDRLLDQARATPEEAARAGVYRQAEAAILAALPVVPVLAERHAAVLAAGVEGFDLTPWGAVDLAAVSLSA